MCADECSSSLRCEVRDCLPDIVNKVVSARPVGTPAQTLRTISGLAASRFESTPAVKGWNAWALSYGTDLDSLKLVSVREERPRRDDPLARRGVQSYCFAPPASEGEHPIGFHRQANQVRRAHEELVVGEL